MSLELAIVPLALNYENDAHDIMNEIKVNAKKTIDVVVDTNYNITLNSRLAKYRKQEKDIITVNNDYKETKCIVIRFSGKGSRPTCMPLQELIELISSLEDDDEIRTPDKADEDDDNHDDSETKNDNKEEGGCLLM